MNFLKPAARPWRHTDFAYSRVRREGYGDALLHILRTTALVESRADQYGDYLRAVFAPRNARWREAIDGWNGEEREHGRALRRLCESLRAEFPFDGLMQAYLAGVHYHACDGSSVRGDIAGELIARCVVEALASTFYRVLRDACSDETGRTLLNTLAQDEARHYGMFLAMLDEEGQRSRVSLWQRLRVGLGRMLELSDDQIMFAAWLVESPPTPGYGRKAVTRRYQAALYPLYRYEHLYFAARLLGPVLLGRRSEWLNRGLAAGLWLGLRVRGGISAACLRSAQLRQRWASPAAAAKLRQERASRCVPGKYLPR